MTLTRTMLSLLFGLSLAGCALQTELDLADGGPQDAASDANAGDAAPAPTWAVRTSPSSPAQPVRVARRASALSTEGASTLETVPQVQVTPSAPAAVEEQQPADVPVDPAAQPEQDEAPVPTPAAMPGVERCGKRVICVPATPDPVAACEAALTLARVEGAYAEPSSCSGVLERARAGKGPLREAALVEVSEYDLSRIYVMALAGEHGFDRVLTYFSEGMSTNENTEVQVTRFAFEQLVPGGAPELRVETREKYEYWYCDESGGGGGTSTTLGMCGLDGRGQPYCVSHLPLSFRRADFDYSFATDKRTYHHHERFRLSIRFGAHHVSLRLASGRAPDDLKPLLGRHRLDQFAELRTGTRF